jgi:hypothetical protein
MTKTKLTTMLTLGGAGAALIVSMFALWGSVGWTTPNQALAAHASLQLENVLGSESLKLFRDEWKCDEYDEELLEAREALIRARDAGQSTVQIEHLIEKIKGAMNRLVCSRFEDFG